MGSDRYRALQDKYGLSKQQLDESGVVEIHKDFRIIAMGEKSVNSNWLTSEILSLFLFHEVRNFTKVEEMNIIAKKVSLCNIVEYIWNLNLTDVYDIFAYYF